MFAACKSPLVYRYGRIAFYSGPARPTFPACPAPSGPKVSAQPAFEPARGDLTGCPWHDVKAKLRDVGLRPTRQRMALGWILFAKGDRHVTAEMLYEEATRAKVPVSLATVYNTLHQFTEVGLLRQVAVDGSKAYFDTNNSEHHHFFIEDQNDLMDIPVERRGRRQGAGRARRLRDRPYRCRGQAAAQALKPFRPRTSRSFEPIRSNNSAGPTRKHYSADVQSERVSSM